MYKCPSCGSALRFDIALQKLKCDHCNTTLAPDQHPAEQNAEEKSMYDVTIFTCPQCGGEISSTDNSAVGFCSFCGASTLLSSRLQSEKRPALIIPFKKTKEDCKQAYSRLLKHAFFAPNDLKNPDYIDRFRGIYMPYWYYTINQSGHLKMKGEKTHREGDYILTDHYQLSCDVDAHYNGISYDASSSFDDTISETIAPFKTDEKKDFIPTYLSGFYADLADVDHSLYEADAMEMADDNTVQRINSSFSKYSNSSPEDALHTKAFHNDFETAKQAMYPVWFLTYRNKNRVAYAIMNGQTGKIAADIPIDSKKYTIGSFLLAIPIFLILTAFFTLKPNFLLTLSIALAIITAIIYAVNVYSIRKRENHDNDKGYQTFQDSGNIPKQKLHIICDLTGVAIAIIISFGIKLLNPVSDNYYYGGVIISFICIFITILTLIQKYNILATRPLPHFNRQGGNDHA